jgi:hypothetical protein
MKISKKILLLVAICSLALFACKKDCKDRCVITKSGLPMSGDQEVPVRQTNAYGKIKISYNKCENILEYTVSWNDLTGLPVGAHIHGTASRGVNAPIKHDFAALIPKATSGTFTNSVKVDGIAIKEDSLLAGFYYINIHTPKFPGGEIRGQIEFQ